MDLGNPLKIHVNQLLKVAILLLGIFTTINEVYAGTGVGRSGRWFTYNDEPKYLVGFDTQELVANQSIDIPATLQKLADYRINKIRVWTYCWFMGDAGSTPWQKVGGVHNLDAWDEVVYWPRMRMLAAEARARNIVVEVAIFAPYPNTTDYWWDRPAFRNAWNKNFNSNSAFSSNADGHFYPEFYDLNYGETTGLGKTLKTYQQALVDKVVAELGSYDNVYFEVANEFAVAGYGAPANAINEEPRLRAWQENWVQRIDTQTSRLIAVHSDADGYGQGTPIWNSNGLIDILNFRLSNASPNDISNILHNIGAQTGNKILAINETTGGASGDFYQDLDLHTRYAWGMFLSGGHVAFYEDNASRILNDARWELGASRLKVLRDIAESVRFWEMSPVNPADGSEYDSLISQGPAFDWQVLANPGSQYVAYFWGSELSTNVVINLPTGSYSYDWYDVRSKNLLGMGTVTSDGNTAITPPAAGSWNGSSGLVLTIKREGGQTPFPGPDPHAIPGTIQAENFDNGGEGAGYHDFDVGNNGGAYRSENVDIQASQNSEAGGFDVGWTQAGEWLNYSVNVASAVSYTLEVRVASNGQGGTFHIEFGGVDKTGPITVPNTGGWQNWQTLTRTVSLSAGPQTMRIVMDADSAATGSMANINWVRLTSSGAGSPPIAHWKLDDATGTMASDASGNGHTGTLVNGPAWTTGIVGGALSFDGANDYLVVPHHDALNAPVLSIAGWVKLSSQSASNYQVLWQKLQVNDANGYYLLVHPTNDATPSRLEWTGANGATYYPVFSSTALANNVWYHVVVTFSGSTSKVYVNGNLEGSNTAASKGTTTDPFYLGIEDGSYGPLNGVLDDVRVYDRELSVAEIQALYNGS